MGLCCLGALRGLWGFLCACIVRRFRGLRRICLSFSLFCLSFSLFCLRFSSFVLVFALLLCSLPSLRPLCSGCPRLVLSLSLWVVLVVSFSLSDYTQKERAQFLASSLVLLWVQILVQLSKNSLAVYLAFSSSSG